MAIDEMSRMKKGARMPSLELVRPSDSSSVTVPRRSRDAYLLAFLPPEWNDWSGYVAELNESRADIEQWYARIVVVVDGDVEAAREMEKNVAPDLQVLATNGANTFDDLGITPGSAVMTIVDRYDQIYEVTESTSSDGMPEVDEVQEWAKYLATQCPECGVIDEPGQGPWTLN